MRNPQQDTLAARFSALWSRCSATGSDKEIWHLLQKHYSEPHRRYHNLDHVEHCLTQLDLIHDRADEADAIELSIWFHDLYCDVGQPDNEARSAGAYRDLAGDHQNPALVARVEQLILTTTHEAPSDDAACQAMADIDLSGLGLPWLAFCRDSKMLKEEAVSTPPASYNAGKLKFFDMLLRRPHIFQTGFFRDRLEVSARSNIERYQVELL